MIIVPLFNNNISAYFLICAPSGKTFRKQVCIFKKECSLFTNMNKLIFEFSIHALSSHFISNFLAFTTR